MATDRNEKFRRWERSWERFRLREYPQPECILPHVVEDKARAHPDRVVFQFRDLPITSGELNENVNKFAVMLPNCPEYVYAWFGLAKIGAVEVTINQQELLVGEVEKYKLKKEGVTPACWDREKAGYTLRR